MDIQQFVAYLTEGLDEATAATVRAAVQNEAVKAKVGTLRQQREFDEIQTRATQADTYLQELDAVDAQGNPRGYRAWYKKYYDTVAKNAKAIEAFEKKHGAGAFERVAAGEEIIPSGGGAGLKPEDVQKQVNEIIQTTYAPKWSELLTGTGAIVQKHIRAGRKNDIDFTKLSEIAAKKGGDLMAAYDEYDAPEREAASKASEEARIKQGIEEGIKARSNNLFPAAADASSSGGGSPLSKPAEAPKYDRRAMLETAASGKYEPAVN